VVTASLGGAHYFEKVENNCLTRGRVLTYSRGVVSVTKITIEFGTGSLRVWRLAVPGHDVSLPQLNGPVPHSFGDP
jgi:hypothetical protein